MPDVPDSNIYERPVPQPTDSPRKIAFEKIVAYLESTHERWTAPYGILPGEDKLRRGGKVRVVTFGWARYLDATIKVWSHNRITCEAQGPAATKFDGVTWDSAEACIEFLKNV